MKDLNKNQCLATYADRCYIQNPTEKLSRYATYRRGGRQTEAQSISENTSEVFWGTILLITSAIFSVIVIIVSLWHFHCFYHTYSFMKNSRGDKKKDMRYWLTYHIGRRKIDGIRFSRLHKWAKWNNRLVVSEVVWNRGEKIFQTKLWLLSWWFTIGMFFQLWKSIPISI